MTAKRNRGPQGWLEYGPYLLPIMIGFLAIVAVPLAFNVWFSLHSWKGGRAPMRWVGLNNYAALFTDGEFLTSFSNSLYMIMAIVVIPTILGLVLASVVFNLVAPRYGQQIAAFLRASYYLPQILPIAVAGFIWSWILNGQDGALNSALGRLGLPTPDWLGDPNYAMSAVMMMLVWLQLGYPVVVFMSALGRVDPSVYEAADLDGANWWNQLRSITIPEIRPEIFIVVLTATVGALKVFAPILILTGGGPEGSPLVPSYYAYRNFFELSKVGYGSAISTFMAIVILIIAAFMMWYQRRAEEN